MIETQDHVLVAPETRLQPSVSLVLVPTGSLAECVSAEVDDRLASPINKCGSIRGTNDSVNTSF